MRKEILVIGLGQFGMAIVKALISQKVRVTAVDLNERNVQMVAPDVDQALCFDATDEEALAAISPSSRDVCICTAGDQSKEAAIICTALLKQMGAKRIIARANDKLHERILRMVGAHEVVNPELEFGTRFANHIVHEQILEVMSFGSDLEVTEFKAPKAFIGKTLAQLELRRKHQVTVVAKKTQTGENTHALDPDEPFQTGDTLILVSKEGAVAKLLKDIGVKDE